MRSNAQRIGHVLRVGCLLLCAGLSSAHAQAPEVIAISGVDSQNGPNLGPSVFFHPDDQLRAVRIVPATGGNAVFWSRLQDYTSSQGMFVAGGPGGPRTFALTGTTGPYGPQLGPTDVFALLCELPRCVAAGPSANVVFTGIVRSSYAVYRWNGVALSPLILANDAQYAPANGLCTRFGSSLPVALLVNAGESVLAQTYCSVPDGRRGIWLHSGTQWDARVIEYVDDRFGPNLGSGTHFLLAPDTDNERLALRPDGVAFLRGETNTGFAGIWELGPASNTPRAITGLAGALGPGIDNAVFAAIDGRPLASANGGLLFRATLQGAGAPAGTNIGLFQHRDGVNFPIARIGTTGPLGPNLGGPEVFLSLELRAAWASDRQLAFLGSISGPTATEGLWAGPVGQHRLRARTGVDGALGPGLGTGVTFSDITAFVTYPGGDVAFFARIAGPGVTPGADDEGIWVSTPSNPPTLLLRTGAVLDSDPGPTFSPRIVDAFEPPMFAVGGVDLNGNASVADRDGYLTIVTFFVGGSSGVVRMRAGASLFNDGFE